MKKISFIITIFVLTLCLSSTPAFSGTFKIGDADFKLGGKVQYNVGYEFHDLGDVAEGVEDSKTNIFSEVPGTSRFYIGANYDNVEGYFEVGAGTSSVAVRHAYLQYDLGGGNKLMAGQYWSLVGFHFPALRFWGDDAMIGFGKLYTGRNPQLRFTHQADNFAFKVSIEDVKSSYNPAGGANYTINEILPALMVSLDIIGDNYVITPNAMVQQYELTGNEGFDDIDIMTWALVLDGVIKSGKIAFDYEAWYGQNVGVSASLLDRRGGLNGRAASTSFGRPPLNGAGDDVEDVSAYGGFVQLTAPVAKAVMHLGAGYQQSDTELDAAGFEDDVTTMAAFVNFDFNLAKGFIVSPEVVYLDNGDDANKTNGDLGSSMLVGVHFEYNF